MGVGFECVVPFWCSCVLRSDFRLRCGRKGLLWWIDCFGVLALGLMFLCFVLQFDFCDGSLVGHMLHFCGVCLLVFVCCLCSLGFVLFYLCTSLLGRTLELLTRCLRPLLGACILRVFAFRDWWLCCG